MSYVFMCDFCKTAMSSKYNSPFVLSIKPEEEDDTDGDDSLFRSDSKDFCSAVCLFAFIEDLKLLWLATEAEATKILLEEAVKREKKLASSKSAG